jgi:hypothetical protein
MGEYVAGTDSYDSRDYGTGTGTGHAAIVADRTGGSQRRVVDVNQDGSAGVPTVDSCPGRLRSVPTN